MEARRILLSNSHRAKERYAQIEKECLAGVDLREVRPNHVWSGIVQTLNRPNTSRTLDNATLRCQRLLMILMRYNVKAEYSPGKTLVVSNALPRSPINDPFVSSTEEDVNPHVHIIESNMPVSPGERTSCRHPRETMQLLSLQPDIP